MRPDHPITFIINYLSIFYHFLIWSASRVNQFFTKILHDFHVGTYEWPHEAEHRKSRFDRLYRFLVSNFKHIVLSAQKEFEALLWICFTSMHMLLIFFGKIFFDFFLPKIFRRKMFDFPKMLKFSDFSGKFRFSTKNFRKSRAYLPG